MPTGNGTWDSDYAFIYEFIEILERLFQMFTNILGSLGGNKDDAAGDNAAAGDTENE